MAPGSSGFGKATVGKSGSGTACSATTLGSGKPHQANARLSTSPPTPCSGVYAAVTSRAVPRGSRASDRRYASTIVSSSTRRPVSRGSSSTRPTASIAVEISRSSGGMICAPSSQ